MAEAVASKEAFAAPEVAAQIEVGEVEAEVSGAAVEVPLRTTLGPRPTGLYCRDMFKDALILTLHLAPKGVSLGLTRR